MSSHKGMILETCKRNIITKALLSNLYKTTKLFTLPALLYGSSYMRKKKTDKQIFNRHRYDTILSEGNL